MQPGTEYDHSNSMTKPWLHIQFRAAFVAVTVIVLATAGCSRKGARSAAVPPADSGSTDAPLEEGRFRLRGTIVSVNQERGTLLVDHEEIVGLMPAMTMEFHVTAGDLANARPGQHIRGVIYQASDGFHLEQIWPVDAADDDVVQKAATALHQDTAARGRGVYREVGENLPDFALYDQTGMVVAPERLRGRQIVLNFIYTRCPDPNMCPLSTSKMMQLQQLAADAKITNLQLLSITLDPAFDTPGVLRAYAEQRGIDTRNFSFLTGPERAIKDLLAQLGVQAFRNGPLIQHTLATVLINPDGRIVYRAEGSQWRPEDFLPFLRRGMSAAP